MEDVGSPLATGGVVPARGDAAKAGVGHGRLGLHTPAQVRVEVNPVPHVGRGHESGFLELIVEPCNAVPFFTVVVSRRQYLPVWGELHRGVEADSPWVDLVPVALHLGEIRVRQPGLDANLPPDVCRAGR